MALPTSGVLDLSDIQTEFGGSNPISLSEYYAGGSYVPSGTSGTNGAVPTSGEIAVSDFYGTQSGITVTVTEGNAVTLGVVGFSLANKIVSSPELGYAAWQTIGSRTPTTVNSVTINGLYFSATKYAEPRFYFTLQGNRAQNFVTSLNIQGYGAVTTAAADSYGYLANATETFWRWNISPTGWDGTGTRTVTISQETLNEH